VNGADVLYVACRSFRGVSIDLAEGAQPPPEDGAPSMESHSRLEFAMWRLRALLDIAGSARASVFLTEQPAAAAGSAATEVLRECVQRVRFLAKVMAGPMMNSLSSCTEAMYTISALLMRLEAYADMFDNKSDRSLLKSNVALVSAQSGGEGRSGRDLALELAVEIVGIRRLYGRLQLISNEISHTRSRDVRHARADECAQTRQAFLTERQFSACALEQVQTLVCNLQNKLASGQRSRLAAELAQFAHTLCGLRRLARLLGQRAGVHHDDRFLCALREDLGHFTTGWRAAAGGDGGLDRYLQDGGDETFTGTMLFEDPLAFLLHCLLGSRPAAAGGGGGACGLDLRGDEWDGVLSECLRAELLRGRDPRRRRAPGEAADERRMEMLAIVWVVLPFNSSLDVELEVLLLPPLPSPPHSGPPDSPMSSAPNTNSESGLQVWMGLIPKPAPGRPLLSALIGRPPGRAGHASHRLCRPAPDLLRTQPAPPQRPACAWGTGRKREGRKEEGREGGREGREEVAPRSLHRRRVLPDPRGRA
jgi:hypothetical protein